MRDICRWTAWGALLVTGCTASTTSVDAPTVGNDGQPQLKQIVVYVAGMNQQLKIL